MTDIDSGPPSRFAADWCRIVAQEIPSPADGKPRWPYRRSHPAMSIRCPWCHARPDAWCYRIVRRSTAPVAGFFHPSRVEAVGMEFIRTLPAPDGSDAPGE